LSFSDFPHSPLTIHQKKLQAGKPGGSVFTAT
jgi:hypothetical protein